MSFTPRDFSDEIRLAGGVANAGSVTRQGPYVLRPSNPYSDSVHRFLTAVHEAGFDGASMPVGIDPDGRERLVFVEGDVPLVPYPDWSQSDEALASMATLMRDLHRASATFPFEGLPFSDEMADPAGGPIVCHNDVCLENVVFRTGRAVAFIDFDFAAPGRPVYDLSRMASMCVPVDDDDSASRLGFVATDRPARLRLLADAYGLGSEDRSVLLGIFDAGIAVGGEFIRRRVEAGEPSFLLLWQFMGGAERYDRRRRWWAEWRPAFAAALR